MRFLNKKSGQFVTVYPRNTQGVCALLRNDEYLVIKNDDWKESDHPRDKDGKFSNSNENNELNLFNKKNKKEDLFNISGTTRDERAKKIKYFSEKFAENIKKETGFETKIEHSGSIAGPSSYVYISHPSGLISLKYPFRFSDHSKGAFNNQFVINIHSIEDIEKYTKEIKELKSIWNQKVKEKELEMEKQKIPQKKYSEKKLQQKAEYERKKALNQQLQNNDIL